MRESVGGNTVSGVSVGGNTVGGEGGSSVQDGSRMSYNGGGMGLGQRLVGDGPSGGGGGDGVSGDHGRGVRGVSGHQGSGGVGTVSGDHGGSGVGTVRGDHGGDVSDQLLSENGGGTGGGAVQLSLDGLHGVDRLPGVVLGGVDGLSVDLGGLVVELTGGVDGGTDVVGGFYVGVDGGTGEVTGGDGRGGGGDGVGDGNGSRMSDGVRGGVSHRKRRCVSHQPVGVGCQQGARGRGCGGGEDGGGEDLQTERLNHNPHRYTAMTSLHYCTTTQFT